MKILKLRFENLNSLAGKWEIDFTAPEYQDGLFLITGDTGAGKTTILDAISLALYGRTAREQVSTGSNEVMTRGTGIARAEVEFACAAGRFRALWEQRRARGQAKGSLQNVRVMLEDCTTGKFIAEGTKSDALGKIKSLVGLSFAQFQRTMMLAQGKFDQFLTADESDRAEILQQAAGTDIYEKIGAAIFARRREVEASAKELETRIDEIKILSDDERAAKTQEREDALAASRELAKRIDAAQKALAKIVQAENECASAAADFRKREKALASCAARAAKCDAALAGTESAFRAAEDAFKAKAPLVQRAVELNGKIALAEKDVAARRNDLENLRRAETDENEAKRANEQKKSRCGEIAATVALALDENTFAPPKAKRTADDKIVKLAADFTKLSDENNSFEAKRNAFRAELEKLAAALEVAENAYREKNPILVANLENAQRAYDASVAFASLDDWRRKLESDKPCPLCGSISHPYSAHGDVPEKSVCEQALADAREALAALAKTRDAARERRDAAFAALSAHENAHAAARGEYDRAKQGLCEARSALAATVAACDDALAKTGSRLAKLASDIASADTELAKAGYAAADLKAKYGALGIGPNPEKEREKLQQKLDAAKDALAAATADAAAAKANRATAAKELEHAAKSKAASEDALAKILSASPPRDALEKDAGNLKREKSSLDAKTGALDAELKQYAAQRKRLEDYREKLAATRSDAARWKQLDRWLGGANGEQFKRFAHGITLRQLLEFANPHLAKMTAGRYQMEWLAEGSAGGAKLLPSLVDNEQGGVSRPVSNLSGGERFQVSLALALGLSEMSSARLDVESLFLDEGFGTLDDNTLEAALDTLCAVQQDGKLIGVISHVAGVAERLATQIHVAKTGNGRSTVAGPGVTNRAAGKE